MLVLDIIKHFKSRDEDITPVFHLYCFKYFEITFCGVLMVKLL